VAGEGQGDRPGHERRQQPAERRHRDEERREDSRVGCRRRLPEPVGGVDRQDEAERRDADHDPEARGDRHEARVPVEFGAAELTADPGEDPGRDGVRDAHSM
jgi:hypothetical protein